MENALRPNLTPNELTINKTVVMGVHSIRGVRWWAGKVMTIDVKTDHVTVAGYPYKDAMRYFSLTLHKNSAYSADSGESVEILEPLGSEGQSLQGWIARETLQVEVTETARVVKRQVSVAKQSSTLTAAPGTCLCGCGTATKGGKFVPGHDAKVKSLLKKVIKGELPSSAIPSLFAANYSSVAFCIDNPDFMQLMGSYLKQSETQGEVA